MKITRKQLRRIIRESMMSESPIMMGQAPMGAMPSQKMYKAVVDTLSKNPKMSGAELVDSVNQMHRELDAEAIYDFLDELLDDGEVMFNVAEDEWSLAEGITRRHLRRIIKEQLAAAGKIRDDVPQSLTSKLYEAVMETLEEMPGVSGAELVDSVNQMHPDVDAELIYEFLDELLDDGEVMFDVENDAWSLA